MSYRRTVVLPLVFLLIAGSARGQFNIQQHYDLGRRIQTTTAEFFQSGTRSTVFAFADINYDSRHFDKKGATDLWYEIAWYYCLPFAGILNGTLQYNDGIYFYPLDATHLGTALQRAWLAGVSYPFRVWNLSLPLDLLVRWQEGDNRCTFQATLVWFLPVGKHFVACGVADLWTNASEPALSFQAEPQLLANWGHAAVGLELEISRAFPGAWTANREYFTANGQPREDEWWCIPTVFVKYTF